MQYALSAKQMREAEEQAIASGTTTLAELMDRAGAAVAAEVTRKAGSGPVTAVCGPGNNGGDGWVAARVLHEHGREVRVVSLASPEALPEAAAAAARRALASGVPFSMMSADTHAAAALDVAVVIDAMFGFGFRGPVREPASALIEALNAAAAYVISVDVPSGVDADTGAVSGPAVRADATVTFSAAKPGLLIYPGAEYAGAVTVADIGIPEESLQAADALALPALADLRPLLPVPAPNDHKGSRGRVAVVAGSRAYAGAAVLAAQGALRMGAGYVIAVVPECIGDVVRASLPNVIVRTFPAALDGSIASVDAVITAVSDADAVVAGPGLTTAQGVAEVIHALLAGVAAPLVLDADALNALVGDADPLGYRTGPLVLTPHPGEAARLLGTDAGSVQADRVAAAVALTRGRHVCVLKGSRSIVAGPERRALVQSGNAGLARAGSGDVLTGMLGTLLAQGVGPFDAAVLAVHLHGRAAEYGTARFTETCFTSADIASFLPDAVRELQGG